MSHPRTQPRRNRTEVPWLRPRKGREGVAEFFASLAAVEFHKFSPKEILESGDVVVSLIDVEFVVKATGKRVVEEDEVHIWRFDSKGQVARFRHQVDTLQHTLAFRG